MATFSENSVNNLTGVHPDLQTLFNEVVRHWDCSIIYGMRTQQEQYDLYLQGRSKPGSIVTYMDGFERRSKHQDGLAVDVIPYPEAYTSRERMREFGQFVMGVAVILKKYRAIDHDINWGGNWNWEDLPHYEIAG